MGDGGSGLDGLARDLAAGEISRRTALRRFAGVALTAAVPSVLLSESALARCPRSRRCNGKCCPRNARCRRGKCKCKSGFTKCGKKCVDLDTSSNHCGGCGQACPAGEVCANGSCVECRVDADCPGQTSVCGRPFCSGGTCGRLQTGNPGTPCDDGNACTENDMCGNGATLTFCVGTPKVCTPQDACHAAGTCNPGTGQCSNPQEPNGTVCGVTAVGCDPGEFRDLCCNNGNCTTPCGTCA